MRKRGQGHVEFILSLILFIGAVTFAFFFLNPAADSELADSTLPFTFSQIRSNVSVELDSYSISLAGSGYASVPILGLDREARVESYDGLVLPSRVSVGNVEFDSGTNRFAVIKISEDFNPPTLPFIPKPPPEQFTIASTSSVDIISEKRVRALNDSYFSDYDGTRQGFDLPPVINFAFALVFSDDDFIRVQREIPAGLEVFSTIKRIEVLREDGTTTFADFSVTVW